MKAEKAANIALENDELTVKKDRTTVRVGFANYQTHFLIQYLLFIDVKKKQANHKSEGLFLSKSRYALGSGIFRNGKTSLSPTTEAAFQAAHIIKTKGSQYRQGHGGTVTTTAVNGYISI